MLSLRRSRCTVMIMMMQCPRDGGGSRDMSPDVRSKCRTDSDCYDGLAACRAAQVVATRAEASEIVSCARCTLQDSDYCRDVNVDIQLTMCWTATRCNAAVRAVQTVPSRRRTPYSCPLDTNVSPVAGLVNVCAGLMPQLALSTDASKQRSRTQLRTYLRGTEQ